MKFYTLIRALNESLMQSAQTATGSIFVDRMADATYVVSVRSTMGAVSTQTYATYNDMIERAGGEQDIDLVTLANAAVWKAL